MAANGVVCVSEQSRLISFTTLFLAVVLPIIALFVFDDKNLARIAFAVVVIAGYGYILQRWIRRRLR